MAAMNGAWLNWRAWVLAGIVLACCAALGWLAAGWNGAITVAVALGPFLGCCVTSRDGWQKTMG